MNVLRYIAVSVVVMSVLLPGPADSLELSGSISMEGRYFIRDPLYAGQEEHNAAISMQQELYHEFSNGSSMTFSPFVRYDSADPERTIFDIRELNYLWLGDHLEIRAGIGKVFWGVTEFVHLVDIINQTDLVAHIDGETKLGQPMLNITLPSDFGVLKLFVLPYFRLRTYPGADGRLRGMLPVDNERAEFESDAEQWHTDYALRYSHTLGAMDLGIYQFVGTSREPSLVLRLDPISGPYIAPYYAQVSQTGLDMQLVAGDLMLKLEALYRKGKNIEDFFASVSGFEITFVNLLSSGYDISLLGEWAYDERGQDSSSPFNNDVMGGIRFAFNDASSTEALVGYGYDLDTSGQLFSFESSRRIGNSWKITLESLVIIDPDPSDNLYPLRDDDYILVDLSYFF